MWNIKNKTKPLNKKKGSRFTYEENKLVVTYGEREKGRGHIGVGD